ncbi:hypothetical protein [Funiculus sociatus]|uniref:hypothetical protein n=1 Tax=Funiculus sociatus TaxID=450527 RepID=UPI00329997DC
MSGIELISPNSKVKGKNPEDWVEPSAFQKAEEVKKNPEDWIAETVKPKVEEWNSRIEAFLADCLFDRANTSKIKDAYVRLQISVGKASNLDSVTEKEKALSLSFLSKIAETRKYENLEEVLEEISNIAKEIHVANGLKLINKLYNIAKKHHFWWHSPLINRGIDEEVVFEWWNVEKKLTIYVSENTVEFIKVWGADIDSEMQDGVVDIGSDEALKDIWKWIANNN